MKLTQAAKAFDKTTATDAHGTASFLCQFDLYDDARRDGMTVERRIISAAPDVTIPPRRVVMVHGKPWIIGDGAHDYYQGKIIRIKYVGHQAAALATLKTVEQALLGTAGYQFYAATAWVRAAREIEISSSLTNVLTVYAATGEPVQSGHLVLLGSKVLWLRKPYETTTGLQACVADELDNPWDTATLASRVYDPVTDTYTGTPVSATVLRMRWQEHFEYFSRAQGTYERGDCVIWVMKAALNVKINDEVTLSDGKWRALRVTDEGTAQSIHLRRA